MLRRYQTVLAVLLLTGAVAHSACSDATGPETGQASVLLAGDGSVAASEVPAGLRLSLGDVPVGAVGSIDLIVTRVDVHQAGDEAEGTQGAEGGEGTEGDGAEAGWVTLDLAETPLDLLSLPSTGGVEVANGLLVAGFYNQVRLFFTSSTLTLAQTINVGGQDLDPGVYDVTIPSAAETGYKILMDRVEVIGGGTEAIVLELSTTASIGSLIWNTNGFQLSPVMHKR
jgi:hypothetical protein